MKKNKTTDIKNVNDTEIKVILGIDASTTCMGTSVVSYNVKTNEIKVLYVHYVKLKNTKKYKGTDALFNKSKQFKDNFINKVKDWGITDIVIEEPLPGSQNLMSVNTLMKFNGMISQSLYETFNIMPKYISSYDARKYAFPDLLAIRKYNKKDEMYELSKYKKALKKNEIVLFGEYPFSCKKKFILWNKISEMYPDINWSYSKDNELNNENFDASDSLVCVFGYINKERFKGEDPKVIEYKIDKSFIDYTFSFCGKTINKRLNLC